MNLPSRVNGSQDCTTRVNGGQIISVVAKRISDLLTIPVTWTGQSRISQISIAVEIKRRYLSGGIVDFKIGIVEGIGRFQSSLILN